LKYRNRKNRKSGNSKIVLSVSRISGGKLHAFMTVALDGGE